MNTSLMHARTNEAIRPPSNDERRAHWRKSSTRLASIAAPTSPGFA